MLLGGFLTMSGKTATFSWKAATLGTDESPYPFSLVEDRLPSLLFLSRPPIAAV